MNEITDEQRDAYKRMQWLYTKSLYTEDVTDWKILAAMLPSELTNPKPALPTEPGWYLGHDAFAGRDIPVELDDSIFWFNHAGETPHKLGNPERFAPFRRLLVEREPVTRDQAIAAYEAATYATAYHTGIDAILALVNGTDRD